MKQPKSKKGRGGSSHTGGRPVSGKRNISSTSSNPVLQRSPPSISKVTKSLPSATTGENPQSSMPQPTAEQLRFVRPRQRTPPLPPRGSLDRQSSQQSLNPPQHSNHTRLDRLVTRVQQELEDEAEEEDIEEQGQYEEAEEGDGEEDAEHGGDNIPQEGGELFNLNSLLLTPGRDAYLSKLSPIKGEGLWFGRDDEITTKCVKIVQDKFDGPWYSWTVIPKHIQDRYFVELAHRYTWDPVLTPQVREKFEGVLLNRVKGMVSYAKSTGKRPNWIRDTLWKEMEAHWETDEALKKSKNASKSRLSDRGGLGPHKHTSGPKSHERIHQQMEEEEGREVSIGEVFIKTHTRKDGSFVDEKAKKVRESYDRNLQTTISQLDASGTSDAASNTQLLTVEQRNAIFLDSTFVDSRGTPYGIGRLARIHGKGKKRMMPETKSLAIVELEEKLQVAQSKIEEQERYNKLMLEYFKRKDPDFSLLLEGNESDLPHQPSTLPQNTLPTESCSTPQ